MRQKLVVILTSISLYHGGVTLAEKTRLSLDQALNLTFEEKGLMGRGWLQNTLVESRIDDLEGASLKLHQPDGSQSEILSKDIVGALQNLAGLGGLAPKDVKRVKLSPDMQKILVEINSDFYIIDLSLPTWQAWRVTTNAQKKEIVTFSPDSKFIIYFSEGVLWVADDCKSPVRPLMQTKDPERLFYGKLDWVYQEEIYARANFVGYFVSPDSRSIAFLRFNETGVPKFPLVDFNERHGGLVQYHYPKAGDTNPVVDVGIMPLAGGPIRYIPLGREREEYLVSSVSWTPDSTKVLVQVQNRKQSNLELLAYDLVDNKANRILYEESATWVSRLQEGPCWHDKGFYWLSEKRGFAQIYSYVQDQESKQYRETSVLTPEGFDVKNIAYADASKVYYVSNESSLHEDHLYRVDIATGVRSQMSENGYDILTKFSPDGCYAVIAKSTVLRPFVYELHRVEGDRTDLLKLLFTPDLAGLNEVSLSIPEFITLKTRDGGSVQAMLIKPLAIEADRKYPLLIHTYSGPKLARARNQWGGHILWHQFLANEGYAVALVDPRSSSSYGKQFVDASYGQLGVKELLDLEDAAEQFGGLEWIDKQRIGIWGWSFGGFMSAYALLNSQAFKAAVSVAPVTDWALYDSIYTERYMDLPQNNPQGYAATSLILSADKFKGSLLLAHGTLDDNVHFQQMVKFVDALSQAGADFELATFGGSDHGLMTFRKPLFKKFFKFLNENL